jgi:flagellar M-ring protein FliF
MPAENADLQRLGAPLPPGGGQQAKPLEQTKALIYAVPRARLLVIAGTAVLIAAAILYFAYGRREGDYRPLYTRLSPEDAGSIVQKLKEKGVAYRVSDDGGSVLVPQQKLAESRLEMAAAGLPKTGRIGFELFDQTKFGATDFMEHINFRRALEGELERSISAMAEVEQARVHLTFTKDSVFSENRLPAKASILLRLRRPLTEQNVSAIRYLVASAVEGLAPESVSVLDMRGNLLCRPKEKSAIDGAEPNEAVLEYRQKIEKDLLAKINSTLEPLLGPDKFRAAVVAECDFTSGEQSEEILDPGRSVMTSEQHSKETSAVANPAGVPGTASNLPRATPRPGTNTQVTRETSNVAYQTTRTVRRIRMPQGNIKRLSVSVLLDQPAHWEGRGADLRRVVTPPSQETLSRITQVVSAAAGIVEERGDKLVVETLPFGTNMDEPPPQAPAAQPLPAFPKNISGQNLLLGGIAVLLVVAAWSAGRMRRSKEQGDLVQASTLPALDKPVVTGAPQVAPPSETMTQLGGQVEDLRKRRESDRHKELEAAGVTFQKLANDAVELAQKDAELCAGVLRSWLTEPEPGVTPDGKRGSA